ncbi:hypothetical protein [Lacrimispora sp.]|uniref:hypothetical protein n=1 Tax=Lacrimispora sp. TaxID=2719234 RepID=UPI003993DE68
MKYWVYYAYEGSTGFKIKHTAGILRKLFAKGDSVVTRLKSGFARCRGVLRTQASESGRQVLIV